MMLHNVLADSRGIHFEAVTCGPLTRGATDEGSQLHVDRTSSLPGSNTHTYFPYSVCIIKSVQTRSGFTAVVSFDSFTSV